MCDKCGVFEMFISWMKIVVMMMMINRTKGEEDVGLVLGELSL